MPNWKTMTGALGISLGLIGLAYATGQVINWVETMGTTQRFLTALGIGAGGIFLVLGMIREN